MTTNAPDGAAVPSLLADGDVVLVRPVVPSDRAALLAMHRGLSADSLHLRFFSTDPDVVTAFVDRLTRPAAPNHAALVALLHGRPVGAAYYERRADPSEAEMVIAVADEAHGRGVGTLLIEHLAATARQSGVRRWVAAVLPENRRMLGLLDRAGFQMTQRTAGKVVDVVVGLDADETLLAAVGERERSAAVASLALVLRPRSVAVVGAGHHPGTAGHEVVRNLVAGGFAGSIYPVNPHGGSVAGRASYRSIGDIPGAVDLAVLAVDTARVHDALGDCASAGVHGAVVLAAGFAEAGRRGAALQRGLVDVARAAGIRLLGPNCLGLINTDPQVRLNATFGPAAPAAGRIGMLTQSGALAVALLAQAAPAGLGVSTLVSIGNGADVGVHDLLLWWEQDQATDVVALYVESLGSPRKFARAARRVGRNKPVVAVWGGGSPAGASAARSHTAATQLPPANVEALFRQAGVIAVDGLSHLLDMTALLAHQPLPTGASLAVLSNEGGPAVLAADTAARVGVELSELSSRTRRRLRAVLPRAAAVANPVDTTSAVTARGLAAAMRSLLRDSQVGAVLALLAPSALADPQVLTDAIVTAETWGKPVLACVLGQAVAVACLTGPDGQVVPSFTSPEAAVLAFARAARYSQWRCRAPAGPTHLDDLELDEARRIVDQALDSAPAGAWLPVEQGRSFVSAYGIPTRPPRPPALARDTAVRTSVGMTRDPEFGSLIAFTVGVRAPDGTGRALRLLPLTDVDAADLVREPAGAHLLLDADGHACVDVPALERLLLRVARLADDVPELAELELDPVLALSDGVLAASVRARVAPPDTSDPYLRRLPL